MKEAEPSAEAEAPSRSTSRPPLLPVMTASPQTTPLAHALGARGLSRARGATALVRGLGSVGIEAARLLTHSGLARVVLVDDGEISPDDVASNLLLRDEDVGAVRSKTVADRLLHAASADETTSSTGANGCTDGGWVTSVEARGGPLLPGDIHPRCGIDVVVSTGDDVDAQCALNEACRASGVGFVYAHAPGLFAFAFTDLGDAWVVEDARTVHAPPAMLESVTRDEPLAAVTVCDAASHGLRDGDVVTFTSVEGMTELNAAFNADDPAGGARVIESVAGPYAFAVRENTTGYGEFKGGGYVHQQPRPMRCAFRSMAATLDDAASATASGGGTPGGLSVEAHLTLAYAGEHATTVAAALLRSIGSLRCLAPGDDARAFGAASVASVAGAGGSDAAGGDKEDNVGDGELSGSGAEAATEAATLLACGARVEIPAVCVVGGALAANEALKAVSGCHVPSRQWMIFDAVEAADVELRRAAAAAAAPVPRVAPSGVAGVRDIVGCATWRAVSDLRLVLAGAGGVGREVLRVWALMRAGGFGGRGVGEVNVVDGAAVEAHDAARGGVLRPGDKGAPKAQIVLDRVAAWKGARPDAPRADGSRRGWAAHGAWLGRGAAFSSSSSNALLTLADVGRYPEDRLEGVDGIVCAVDTLSDRRAADDLSLRHRCALLDAGVDGDRASVHVAVPHRSVPWSAGPRDPPDFEPPSCVLGNFPHTFAHASKWARDLFRALFMDAPRRTNAYLREPGFVSDTLRAPGRDASARLSDLRDLHASLVADRPLELSACVRWARRKFDELFVDGPNRMLASFPPEQRTAAGVPFWSGTKRQPAPLTFDPHNPAHLTFVVAAANLRAAVYGLMGRLDAEFHHEALEAGASDGRQRREVSREVVSKVTAAAREGSGVGGGDEDDGADVEAAKLAAAEIECEELLASLPARESLAGYRLVESVFASRDTLHAGFVAAAASCRAEVHRIPTPTPHDLASIAADARPGLPAPAAFAAGLVAIETYKLAALSASKDAGHAAADTSGGTPTFRQSYASLGNNVFSSAVPLPVTRATVTTAAGCPDLTWSLWDVIELDGRGGMTLGGFVEAFEKQVGLQASMVSSGASLLFADFMNKQKLAPRLATALADVVAEVGKTGPPGPSVTHITLSVSACDGDDNDVDIPDVRVRIR